jgi:anaerobic magnesium-protoporphyrin IX monomethyl ester cyclase
MAQVVFVNPPLTLEERFGRFAKAGNVMPPLGLCYLAAYTRSKGYKTEILDAPAEAMSYVDAASFILAKKPELVGLTATTLSINNADKLAVILKEKDKDIKIVIGGPHVSAVHEDTLRKLPVFDFGVIGEGEETVVELLEALAGKREAAEVNGLAYRDGQSIRINPPRAPIENLDALPLPAWDMLQDYPNPYKPLEVSFSRKEGQGSLITSRGCPFPCGYCPKSVFGKKVRNHSVNYVMDMIRTQYDNFKVRDIEIYDDTLTMQRERMEELCKALIKENLDLIWSANARIDQVDEEILELMKKSGCWKIAFGVESGDYRVLEKMNKRIDLEKAKKILRIADKMGFVNRGYFIIGYPTETTESIFNTIRYAKESSFHMVQFNAFTPLPGSPVFEGIEKYGEFDNDWGKMNFVNTIFVPSGLDKKKLDKLINRAYMEFYLRPWIVLCYIKRIRTIG